MLGETGVAAAWPRRIWVSIGVGFDICERRGRRTDGAHSRKCYKETDLESHVAWRIFYYVNPKQFFGTEIALTYAQLEC